MPKEGPEMPQRYTASQAERYAQELDKMKESGQARDYSEAEQLLERRIEANKATPIPDRILKNSLSVEDERVRFRITGQTEILFSGVDSLDSLPGEDMLLIYKDEGGGEDRVTFSSPQKQMELEMRGYKQRDIDGTYDQRPNEPRSYSFGRTNEGMGYGHEEGARELKEAIKNLDIVDYYTCIEETLSSFARLEESRPFEIIKTYNSMVAVLAKLSADLENTLDGETKERLTAMKTHMESLVQPLEEKLRAWEKFKENYWDLVQGGGFEATGAKAAEKVLAEAEKNGSIQSAKLPGGEECFFIGEVEPVPGWKVIATLTAKENLFPNAGQLPVNDTGTWYHLDNRGTVYDRTGLNSRDYRRGREAPEGALTFGEFQNTGEYGYRWISPNPFKGEQPKNFSSTWATKLVKLIPPKGAYVACIMNPRDKRFSEVKE